MLMDTALHVQSTRHGGRKLDSQVMTRRVNWLNSIREWQQDFLGSLDAREFVDCVTDELFGKGVFVFTPFGEVMRLPKVSCNAMATKLFSAAVDISFHIDIFEVANKVLLKQLLMAGDVRLIHTCVQQT